MAINLNPGSRKEKVMQKEAHPAERQEFHIRAPGAISVMLAADFTHWQQKAIPMHRETGGLWSTSVRLQPGNYSYRFIVDGEWQDDPECKLHIGNPYGSSNMIRKVA